MTDMNVRLSQRVALDFNLVKTAIANKWGKSASNFDVVVELIQAYKDRKNLTMKMKSLERKLQEKDQEIIAMMREVINKPQPAININVGALAQASSQPTITGTPTLYIPKKVSADDSKGLFQNEINSLLTGGVKMPSEIMEASIPDHVNTELEFIDYEVEQLPLSEAEIKFARGG